MTKTLNDPFGTGNQFLAQFAKDAHEMRQGFCNVVRRRGLERLLQHADSSPLRIARNDIVIFQIRQDVDELIQYRQTIGVL